MFKTHFLISLILILTVAVTNALSLPKLSNTDPEPLPIRLTETLNPVSHLLTLNKTMPANVTYNDVFLYINADINMDLRVPADNIWRPVSNLLCIKRMDFKPINGTIYPKDCATIKVRNATNYGHATCKIMDTISWYIDLGRFTNIDITKSATGKMGHVCCGDECRFTDFHF